MPDRKFTIINTLVEFPKSGKRWHKELNLIKWGDNEPKYDLRGWNEDHSEMTKGVTMTAEELEFLRKNI